MSNTPAPEEGTVTTVKLIGVPEDAWRDVLDFIAKHHTYAEVHKLMDAARFHVEWDELVSQLRAEIARENSTKPADPPANDAPKPPAPPPAPIAPGEFKRGDKVRSRKGETGVVQGVTDDGLVVVIPDGSAESVEFPRNWLTKIEG